MIEILWRRHYAPGLTGSYHGDMAAAWDRMTRDPDCDKKTAKKIRRATIHHMHLERLPTHEGRKWFIERFGMPGEGAFVTT